MKKFYERFSSAQTRRNVERKLKVCVGLVLFFLKKKCLLLCSGINIQAHWTNWVDIWWRIEEHFIFCVHKGKMKGKSSTITKKKMKIIVVRIFTCSSVTLISSQPYLFFLIIMNISFNDWLVSSLSYKRGKTVQIFLFFFEEKKSIKMKTSLMKKNEALHDINIFFLARAVVDFFFLYFMYSI